MVHALFTINARPSSGTACSMKQPDFATQVANRNVIFRIPTPVFGAGLMEQIWDSSIVASRASNVSAKTASCQYAATPNSITATEALTPVDAMSSIEKFSHFMRFLAAPIPSATLSGGATSIAAGRARFASTGCALCHTPMLTTGPSKVLDLSNQKVNLYSDLLLHDVGTRLSDGVSQGEAGRREFRTAPLWGLGQRIFFLHRPDVRPDRDHQGAREHESEANGAVNRFLGLSEAQKQNLLNFLRSLYR